jgi:predicted enzyme related to lactoylglutathione lyase
LDVSTTKSNSISSIAAHPCKKRKDGAPSLGAVQTNIVNDGLPVHYLSELESTMNAVQVEQKSYEMPPKEGISIAHFLTVADVNRSARYYEKVFGARILTMGDGNAPPYLQLANIWMILNVGGGPTPDKPTVTLSTPDPNHINSFMNFRVADIQACYELWKSRGAEFLTPPIPKYGEIRCYIRDPDGYIIEVGQSTDRIYG